MQPTRTGCKLGPGSTAEVSWRTGEETGKHSAKIDYKEKEKFALTLLNSGIIFGKPAGMKKNI